MLKRTHTLLLALLALFLCTGGAAAQNMKTVQACGLEFDIPDDYDVLPLNGKGSTSQTLFRKRGLDDNSMLIVTLSPTFGKMSKEDLKRYVEKAIEGYKISGYTVGAVSPYSTQKLDGFLAKGMAGDVPFVYKGYTFDKFFLQYIEFGADAAAEYRAIEETVRLSPATPDWKSIGKNGLGFVYDANRVEVTAEAEDGTTDFKFSPTRDEDDFYLTYCFTDVEVDDLETFATVWFANMEKQTKDGFAEYYVNPMEKTTLFGLPAYMRAGVVKLEGDTMAKYVLKACLHKGKFTFSVMMVALDENMQPDAELVKMFAQIDESLIESTE